MSQGNAGLPCPAFAIQDNVRLGGSRFMGAVELSARGGRVFLKGRRVPVWWMWAEWILHFVSILIDPLWALFRPDKETADSGPLSLRNRDSVSWPAGRGEFTGKYTSCISGYLTGRRVVIGRHRAYELPPVDVKDSYIVLQVRIPIGKRGSMRLLQLEIPAEREQRLRSVLSGVG